MNLTEGPLLKKIFIFALPVIGVNILQLLFNTADILVVSWFVSEDKANAAVGAVGATTSIINLMIGLFVGLSMGANVVLSRCMGKGDSERAEKVVGVKPRCGNRSRDGRRGLRENDIKAHQLQGRASRYGYRLSYDLFYRYAGHNVL